MRLHRLDYKWVALSNTTMGTLMATINGSILLIALPNIFRGIGIDPLAPGNTSYLLWLILGFLVIMSVLLVSLGRLGDMYGRVRMFRLGFAVFTVFSVLLSVTWMQGSGGALWLILMRIGQGVGGALIFANSGAILTDSFPEDQRGLALGVNSISALAGSFIGLVLGGVLAPISWRLVFLVSVPISLLGTYWSYRSLHDQGMRKAARIDWWGNVTFAIGLVGLMVGITYGIQPYGGHTMGWTAPLVLISLIGGVAVLVGFCFIELHVPDPMFRLDLFKIRAFAGGNIASLLAAMGRGGLQFILIIWLQGIWLPRHGYDFARTPLWAGIYMTPLIVGFLVAGPVSGWLSDRYGARAFATSGLLVAAASFGLLIVLPVDFSYIWFALILLMNGIGMGLFAAPNSAGVMNSLPPDQRGAGAGMLATFQNSASVLSIGVFFTLMIVGLSSTLPRSLQDGLVAHGVSASDAHAVSSLPPVSTLFASLLGYNPMGTLLGPKVLNSLPPGQAATITGRSFFPQLISSPFHSALIYAFTFAIIACLVAAVASLLRGGKYVYADEAGGSGDHVVPVIVLDPIGDETSIMSDALEAKNMTAAIEDTAVERLRRIGEVADEVGITARTIRYYEQLGLLGDGDGRLKGTHRLYSQADVDRLRELIRLRDLLGLSLDELTQLADTVQLQECLRTQWQNTTADHERARIVRSSIPNVERQLDLVHARQRSLAEFEAKLIEKLGALRQWLVEQPS